MPIKKLKCLKCGFTIEDSEINLQNFGLPDDFQKHLTEHFEPKLDCDYSMEDSFRI